MQFALNTFGDFEVYEYYRTVIECHCTCAMKSALKKADGFMSANL